MNWARYIIVVGMLGWQGTALAGPIQFFNGSYKQAQRQAERQSQMMVVKVYADWCGPCKRLQAEIFETDNGPKVIGNAIAVHADFDAPNQQHWMKEWRILNLPTVLFLRPDGSEIGRIEGYEKKEKFLAEAESLSKGEDPLPDLVSQWKQEKRSSKEELVLRVKVGHGQLVRGNSDEGIRLLESAIIDDSTGKAGAAERALFLLGRYYSRVMKNHAEGRHIWRTLYLHFPGGKYENTAAWWYANDLAKVKRRDEAQAFLLHRARNESQGVSALWALVEFEGRSGQIGAATTKLVKSRSMNASDREELKVYLKSIQAKKK